MRSIKSIDELLTISKTDSVELVDDIDCKGKQIDRLCYDFKGVIEGNNHSISNLVVDAEIRTDGQKIALFSCLSHAQIKNVRFENIRFVINRSIFVPQIAGLSVEVSDSDLENITMTVTTSNQENIPMIYDSAGGTDKELKYICNGKEYNLYEYKEDA